MKKKKFKLLFVGIAFSLFAFSAQAQANNQELLWKEELLKLISKNPEFAAIGIAVIVEIILLIISGLLKLIKNPSISHVLSVVVKGGMGIVAVVLIGAAGVQIYRNKDLFLQYTKISSSGKVNEESSSNKALKKEGSSQPTKQTNKQSNSGEVAKKSTPSNVKKGIQLKIDTRWEIPEALIIINKKEGTKEYQVTPVTLMAYGGSPGVNGYTWGKPIGGRFPPPGITIDALTGVLHGTGGALPNPGIYYFDVEVTDGTNRAIATLPITIKEYVVSDEEGFSTPVPEIDFQQAFVDTIKLPNAKAGQPYGATLWVEGGDPPYLWILRPGYSDFTLAGLWLDQNKGLVRGTISESMAGKTIKFAVIVKDKNGKTALSLGPRVDPGPIYEIYVEP